MLGEPRPVDRRVGGRGGGLLCSVICASGLLRESSVLGTYINIARAYYSVWAYVTP
jgi:hypothetical protein